MIVNKFNGKIDFDSIYKKGSTFFFTFEHVPFETTEIENYSKMVSEVAPDKN